MLMAATAIFSQHVVLFFPLLFFKHARFFRQFWSLLGQSFMAAVILKKHVRFLENILISDRFLECVTCSCGNVAGSAHLVEFALTPEVKLLNLLFLEQTAFSYNTKNSSFSIFELAQLNLQQTYHRLQPDNFFIGLELQLLESFYLRNQPLLQLLRFLLTDVVLFG